MSESVNIGIIGAGRIGRLHCNNLANRIPQANVMAIADVYKDAAQQCAKDYHIAAAYDDPRRILDDPQIHAILICSSTDTHAQLIVEAAQAGKHIFCEKPIDFNLEIIDKALAAVKTAGVQLQIGFNRRFDPGFKHARDIVAEGKIGVPHMVRITSRDPQPPSIEYIKVSGGLFLDMTIHDFDMCRYLLNQETTRIYAQGATLVDPEIGKAGDIDTAMITLTYESGAFCTIDNSRQAVYGYDQRVEVFGSEGCVIIGNQTPYNSITYTKPTVERPLPLYFFLERYDTSFLEEMRQFVKCVQTDTATPVSGRDGKIPVMMGLAAQKSLQSGQPVRLSLDSEEA